MLIACHGACGMPRFLSACEASLGRAKLDCGPVICLSVKLRVDGSGRVGYVCGGGLFVQVRICVCVCLRVCLYVCSVVW